MFWRKTPNPVSDKNARGSGADRRRSERLQTAVLNCELGQVLDISRHGVRISLSKTPPQLAPGSPVGLLISSPADGIEVGAKVVRIRHVGYGRYELALDFASITEADALAIESLARTGSRRSASQSDAGRKERLVAALKLPDHYGALGIDPNATADQVHHAFRMLARKYHPDVCNDAEAQLRFTRINEANTVLSDADKRAEYDQIYAYRNAA